MTPEEKTLLPSLLKNIRSDLFTIDNISSTVRLSTKKDSDYKDITTDWEYHINYLPLEYYRIIESYPGTVLTEPFDVKYRMNPKLYAYNKYKMTNMWRPIMILNRCSSILDFNFENKQIKYYDISQFQKIMSILISRSGNE